MNQKTKTKIIISSLLVLLSGLSINAFAVWTGPTGNPLENNIATPILTNEVTQRKLGPLIVEAFRSMGLAIVDKLEVAQTIKIYGGDPGLNKVLVSDATGLASWKDPSTLGIGGGGITGVVPVSLGGTGLTTIPGKSIWVANSLDTVSTLTAGAGKSIRLNAAGTAWEDYTPLTAGGSGGTINTLSKFTGPHSLGDSNITDNGTTITTGVNFKVGSNLLFSSITLGPIAGNIINMELDNAVYFQLNSVSNAPPTIQGFAPPSGSQHVHGRVVYLTNKSSSQVFIIENNSTTTALENRVQMSLNSDLTLDGGETVMLFYDVGHPGGSRWKQSAFVE